MNVNNYGKSRMVVGFNASKLERDKVLSLLKKSSVARKRIRKNILNGTMPIVSQFVNDNI